MLRRGVLSNKETAIDDGFDTLLLIHGDGNTNDYSNSHFVADIEESIVYLDGKFGKSIASTNNGLTTYTIYGDLSNVSVSSDFDYTIEFWLNPTINKSKYEDEIGLIGLSDNEQPYDISHIGITMYYPKSTDTVKKYKLGIEFRTSYSRVIWSSPIDMEGWNHVALVHDSSSMTLKLYLNGVLLIDSTSPDYLPSVSASHLKIFYSYVSNGALDEIRIVKGKKWTSNFVPPDKPYKNPSNI